MTAFDQLAAARMGAASSALPWLARQRSEALAVWQACRLPTRKTEEWKYTGLEALGEKDYLREPNPPTAGCYTRELPFASLDADRLVFINGRFMPELSSVTSAPGVAIQRFDDARGAEREMLGAQLGEIAASGKNPFTALASGWMNDGVLLRVGAGVRMARPLCVLHINRPDAQPFAHAQRLLVVAEEGAEGELIEHFLSDEGYQNSLVTGATELRLARGARLRHTRLQLEEEHSVFIGGIYVSLQADARYESFVFGTGARLKRIDLQVHHRGAGSECVLNGVYLARNSQHIDLHTTVEHELAHGTTQQVYRGIIDDEARAVFNGRIHIHPGAQKSIANLSNRNLLLSNRAEVNTKPELEIYADDVRCSHGATVSQIDEKALYYLRTRGIDAQEAQVLLGFGFINELIDKLPHEALVHELRRVVRNWFGDDARLTRHLS